MVGVVDGCQAGVVDRFGIGKEDSCRARGCDGGKKCAERGGQTVPLGSRGQTLTENAVLKDERYGEVFY